MEKVIMVMIMVSITVLQISAAEQYCLRKGATGSNNGSDWNNTALFQQRRCRNPPLPDRVEEAAEAVAVVLSTPQ
ncbi:MAG: hypothetical protein EHM45_00725 [Desulfobacteraceae bacterium]|nr:MAG: hypothetical protein EHM45_00725 [Desulfobacteraceae bacterium]